MSMSVAVFLLPVNFLFTHAAISVDPTILVRNLQNALFIFTLEGRSTPRKRLPIFVKA